MMRLSQLFPLLLLAALASLTFWLSNSMQQTDEIARPARHDPDYIIEKLTARQMDASGNIKHTLFADHVTHYPDDDTTHLVMPRFVSLSSAGIPITVTSRTGRVSSRGEHIYFETGVHAERAAHGDQGKLTLETDYLEVTPDRHLARTDRPVIVTEAHTVATAIGLELNSETRVVTFLSQFKGIYHDPDRAENRR